TISVELSYDGAFFHRGMFHYLRFDLHGRNVQAEPNNEIVGPATAPEHAIAVIFEKIAGQRPPIQHPLSLCVQVGQIFAAGRAPDGETADLAGSGGPPLAIEYPNLKPRDRTTGRALGGSVRP